MFSRTLIKFDAEMIFRFAIYVVNYISLSDNNWPCKTNLKLKG